MRPDSWLPRRGIPPFTTSTRRVGYNYRLSNLLAALGRSQLADLPRRVEVRRGHNQAYRAALGKVPGVEFMPEIAEGKSTFWLTALTVDPVLAGVIALP